MADTLLAWLERVTDAFARHDVPYAIAGGLALAAWQCPRATTDLDLVIASSSDEVVRARIAADAAGLAQTKRAAVRLRTISLLRMVAAAPHDEAIPVDLLLVPPALEADVLRRAVTLPLGRAGASFASPEDLILLKLLRFADQDVVDIRALAHRNRLDRRYLDKKAAALRVATRLRRALPPRR